MSEVRKIDLDWKYNNNQIYVAEAEIFQDTSNLALKIRIKNKQTSKTIVSTWFNIECFELTEAKEDRLAFIMTNQMLQSAFAARKEKSAEVKKRWNNFSTAINEI